MSRLDSFETRDFTEACEGIADAFQIVESDSLETFRSAQKSAEAAYLRGVLDDNDWKLVKTAKALGTTSANLNHLIKKHADLERDYSERRGRKARKRLKKTLDGPISELNADAFEQKRELYKHALKQTNWNVTQAAEQLGMPRMTLVSALKTHFPELEALRLKHSVKGRPKKK